MAFTSPFDIGKEFVTAAHRIVERIGLSKLLVSTAREEVKVWEDDGFFPLAMGPSGFTWGWPVLDGGALGEELGQDIGEIRAANSSSTIPLPFFLPLAWAMPHALQSMNPNLASFHRVPSAHRGAYNTATLQDSELDDPPHV